jgi:hypothetical protein
MNVDGHPSFNAQNKSFESILDKNSYTSRSTPELKQASDLQNRSYDNKLKPVSRAPKPSFNIAKEYLCRCKANYDYTASRSAELSFKEGDIIDILSKDPSGWWKGKLGAQIGLVPSNYLQEQ